MPGRKSGRTDCATLNRITPQLRWSYLLSFFSKDLEDQPGRKIAERTFTLSKPFRAEPWLGKNDLCDGNFASEARMPTFHDHDADENGARLARPDGPLSPG